MTRPCNHTLHPLQPRTTSQTPTPARYVLSGQQSRLLLPTTQPKKRLLLQLLLLLLLLASDAECLCLLEHLLLKLLSLIST